MSKLDKAIYAELVELNIAGGRVFPRVIPQDAGLPALAFRQISGQPLLTHGGASAIHEGDRYQFSCVGSTHDEARELAETLEMYFEGFTGELGDASQHVSVGPVWVVNVMDVDIGVEPAAFETLVDVMFLWKR